MFELTKLLEYFEIPIDSHMVKEAAEFASFGNMKKMESQRKFKNKRIEPYDPSNLNSVKVRKGRVGGHKQDLSQEDLQWVNGRLNNSLNDKSKSIIGIQHFTQIDDD